MVTEIIIGGTGYGKTTMIKERILADLSDGKKVIVLVPEQAALTTESTICSEALRRNVNTIGLEVLSFKRLCDRAFRQYGGISYNSVTQGAKALIMWDALFSSAPLLKYYNKSLEDSDKIISSLLALASELKSYTVSSAQLMDASRELEAENPKLSSKLFDISIIYSTYLSLISKRYDDPEDDLTKLAALLKENNFFTGTSLYLDSYRGFTPQQYNVLRYALNEADSSVVTLCLRNDPNSFSFECVKDTFKKVKSILKHDPIITVLTPDHSVKTPEIKFLEKNLWNFKDETFFEDQTSNISTVLCSDPYEEADFVVSDILSKLRNGCRLRDFAIIVRDIERYRGIIDTALEKNNLPCRVFKRQELSEKPIFKLIRSAINIKLRSWSIEDVMVYLKTGLCGITPEECYTIENYVQTWNIKGNMWTSESKWYMNPDGYSEFLTDEGAETLRRVNEIRGRIIAPLTKFHECLDGSYNVKTVCTYLYDFIKELGVDEIISNSSDDDEIRLFNCFCDALDTMVDAIPDKKITASVFSGLFSIIVDQSNVGTLPSTIDEILIGNADHIRADNVKHVYLLGANEQIFPASTVENSFFSDNDKALLEEYGINLSSRSEDSANEEMFHFYSSASTPNETLTVLCSQNEIDGSLLRPSIGFQRVKALFPNGNHINTIELNRDIFIQSIQSAVENSGQITKEQKEAVEKCLKDHPEYAFLLSEDAEPLEAFEDNLDSDISKKLYKGDLALTQSRLDQFVQCAFSYQCKYTLKLGEIKRAEFRASDSGTLIHRVLERFFADAECGEDLSTITSDEIARRTDCILNEYLTGIFGEDKDVRITSRASELFKRLRRTLIILIKNIINEFASSEFVPKFFEMPLDNSGKEGTVAPLLIPLPDGNNVYIYGVADRVDICKKNGNIYVRVVDYKTGTKKFSLSDIAMGLNLQMLIYLFSIWMDRNGSVRKALNAEGEIIPAGVLYYEAKLPTIDADLGTSAEEIYEKAENSLKRNGLLINNKEILELMEKKLSGKYIPVKLNKSGDITASAKTTHLASLEEMGKLMQSITDTISKIGAEIKNGKASCQPLKDGNHDACMFCAYKSLCRNPMSFVTSKY